MKSTKNILFPLCLIVSASISATASETWAFDPVNEENNIKTGDFRPEASDYTIDTVSGILTVTGVFENKGDGTVILGGNTFDEKSPYSFDIKGSWLQNHAVMTFNNANVNAGQFFNENAGSVLYIDGKSYTSGRLVTKNGGRLVIKSGAVLAAGTVVMDANGTLEIERAAAGSLTSGAEFQVAATAALSFGLSNDSLKDPTAGIMQTVYAKGMNGKIGLDLSDFTLGDDFVKGSEYTIALVYNSSGQTASGQFDDSWTVLEENVANGEFAEFVGAQKTDKYLYVTIAAVPEAGEYAALFGFSALAFAVLRRKKG